MLYKFCVIPDFNDVYDYVYVSEHVCLCVSTLCNDVAVSAWLFLVAAQLKCLGWGQDCGELKGKADTLSWHLVCNF